jgi:hypothetical protein
MEEDEYKNTYQHIADVRCVYEKALTNNQAKCSFSKHFWLADREGYACKSAECASICSDFLQKLRENSRFSLKLTAVGDVLPHNMDIRVQVGGLQGVQKLVFPRQAQAQIDDIRSLVDTAIHQYGGLQALPYAEIVQSVASFQGRKRRRHHDV